MDGSPPGSPVPGILQAGTLEWVARPFPRGPTPPRDQARASCTGRRIPDHGATWEAPPHLPHLAFPMHRELCARHRILGSSWYENAKDNLSVRAHVKFKGRGSGGLGCGH